MTGTQMSGLTHKLAELSTLVLAGRVFARIEPVQKLEIVQILAASGELVAVTGDGVNDAPALQAAHIGVAMGIAGTDVARGAADLVLADDNFASIVAGVEEGRVTYANVRRIVIILLATGMAEIGMFLGAVAFGLPMPLTAVQLLWLNLVTNGAQDVMLGFGRGEGDELRQPPRAPGEPLLDLSAIALMIPPAVVMTGFALFLVYTLRRDGHPLWAEDIGAAPGEPETLPPAYDDLARRGVLDQCGLTRLAEVAVGAPFVGMVASAMLVSQAMRMVVDGVRPVVVNLDLRSVQHRSAVLRDVYDIVLFGTTRAQS
ncbi:HAD-IC family P-type ATPase [Sphingomonas aerolata]|uniref:HAD-IC family P-type ATPase n=1 Tax=Sphingomonas aerolata TaxID=185951 RepID=UPI00208FE3CE|nr:HAD-IC family P-type ATPase [Sphingomonas aerolata]USR00045.1 HAD-IC family P-type ATPase [Sphingomonas aerolata]